MAMAQDRTVRPLIPRADRSGRQGHAIMPVETHLNIVIRLNDFKLAQTHSAVPANSTMSVLWLDRER